MLACLCLLFAKGKKRQFVFVVRKGKKRRQFVCACCSQRKKKSASSFVFTVHKGKKKSPTCMCLLFARDKQRGKNTPCSLGSGLNEAKC